jgi:hypothetical protein
MSALLSTCFPLALVVRGYVLRCWFETLDFWVFTISFCVWRFPFGRSRISSLFGIPFLGVSKVQLVSISSQGLGVLVEIAFNHSVGLVVLQ